ncbi:MAG: hypothetical protein ACODAG_05745 [Myxococcota bacterium]
MRRPENGVDLYDALRRRGHEALAAWMIFMTGGAFSPRARKFLRSTQAPCLEKPFEPNTLESALRSALNR